MSLVKLKDIQKIYHLGETEIHAIRNIDIEIPEKKFISFVGPSGSGKSTLLNMIGCLDKPTSGEIYIGGTRINVLNHRELAEYRGKNIGFIFQSFNLIQVLTIFENVEYPLITVKKIPEDERKELVEKVLEDVGIYEQRHKKPSQLSGGQMQRAAIARALVTNPSLVLADEPTANLDRVTSSKIIQLMHDMKNKYGTLFIFATHDPRVMSEAEIIYELQDGEIISIEKKEGIYA